MNPIRIEGYPSIVGTGIMFVVSYDGSLWGSYFSPQAAFARAREIQQTVPHEAVISDPPDARWVFGTCTGHWHRVGADDRDYATGMTDHEITTTLESVCRSRYLAARHSGSREPREETA